MGGWGIYEWGGSSSLMMLVPLDQGARAWVAKGFSSAGTLTVILNINQTHHLYDLNTISPLVFCFLLGHLPKEAIYLCFRSLFAFYTNDSAQ